MSLDSSPVVHAGGPCEACKLLVEVQSKRIANLKAHRTQWRRIAYRLLDELMKHDPAQANAIFADATDLRAPSEQTSETTEEKP